MKKFVLAIFLSLFMTGTAEAQNLMDFLRGLAGSSSNSAPVSNVMDICGCWTYRGVAVGTDGESGPLMSLATEAAAPAVEARADGYLAKMGIQSGVARFTFNTDGSFDIGLGRKAVPGTWEMEGNSITLQFGRDMASMRVSGFVKNSSDGMKLLFPADGFLKIAGELSRTVSESSGKSSLNKLASIADMVEGVAVGFNLEKIKTDI